MGPSCKCSLQPIHWWWLLDTFTRIYGLKPLQPSCTGSGPGGSSNLSVAHFHRNETIWGFRFINLPSGHQTWLENPRTEWRFLTGKIMDFYDPWLPASHVWWHRRVLADDSDHLPRSSQIFPLPSRPNQPSLAPGIASSPGPQVMPRECRTWPSRNSDLFP